VRLALIGQSSAEVGATIDEATEEVEEEEEADGGHVDGVATVAAARTRVPGDAVGTVGSEEVDRAAAETAERAAGATSFISSLVAYGKAALFAWSSTSSPLSWLFLD